MAAVMQATPPRILALMPAVVAVGIAVGVMGVAATEAVVVIDL